MILAKLEWTKQAESQPQLQDVCSIIRQLAESLDHTYLNTWIAALNLQSEWEAVERMLGAR